MLQDAQNEDICFEKLFLYQNRKKMALQLQNLLQLTFTLGRTQNPYWKLTKTWSEHAE